MHWRSIARACAHRLFQQAWASSHQIRPYSDRNAIEPLEGRLLLATTPVICEFLASNDTGLKDQDGDRSDWIEIYNPAATSLNLEGYYLTDSGHDLRMWRFPSTIVQPGGYQLVFASGKDRRVPGFELHTNFQLDSNGEYLALVAPDGTTVLSDYSPTYPAQLTDISYGIATDFTSTSLISAQSPVKAYVPTNGNLGSLWTQVNFDDSAWLSGVTGAGFDVGQPPPRKGGFSVRMVNVAGAIGDVGTAEKLLAKPLPGGYSLQADLTADYSVVNHGLGGNFGSDQLLPNGATSDEEYVLCATADVYIPAGTWSVNVGSDDGFKLVIPGVTFTSRFNEGAVLGADTLAFPGLRGHDNTTGSFTIPAGGLNTRLTLIFYENSGGDDVELSVASGTQTFNGNFVLLSDGVIPGWQVKTTNSAPPPDYKSQIGLSLSAPMYNHNASAYIRIPLGMVENPADFDVLRLRMKYDDGFIAYLNGTEIARRNAPAAADWYSSASAEHADASALVYEDINVAIPDGLLKAGSNSNVLAIQGLNRGAGDDDFLIYPELLGIHTLGNVDRYFTNPTPGAPNDNMSLIQVVADTKFSQDRGFYDSPFQLVITTDTPDATIRYTTDGSVPTATTGTVYTGPITISTTTAIRAAAFKPGFRASNVDTQTYIFLNDVIRQATNPAGFPTRWTGVGGDVVADYAMDPNIVNNTTWGPKILDGLKSLPSISITTSRDDMFGTNGIYTNSGMAYRGQAWERPASIEMMYPDGSKGFQIDAGVRMYGNVGSEPSASGKHTFRLRFDQDLYGAGKLNDPLFKDAAFGDTATDQFDTLILRASFNNCFTWAGAGATYLQDAWSSQTQLAMGQPASHGTFVHLYVDGLYWGLYNPVERPDASFMASYFGGSKDDYDLNHEGEMISGNWTAWNTMMSIADAGVATQTAYDQIRQYLDVDNLIDYLILNFYGGNWDWDGHNWYLGRKREAGAGFKFFNWDGEGNLQDPNANITDQDRGPITHLYLKLRQNPEFRMTFADHVYKDLINSHGPLTDANAIQRWTQLAAGIDTAIIAESARWGDWNRGTAVTYNDWAGQIAWRTNSFFPGHANTVLGWFRGLGLYPNFAAPEFNQDGGQVDYGFRLSMTNPSGQGVIYFTTDGSDPRLVGGAVSTTALPYSSPISLTRTTEIKARVRLADGSWSALHDATFLYNMSSLRVTEVMYDPQPSSLYSSSSLEFIELQNTGAASLILDGLKFTNGITFTFPDTTPDTTLAPGERMVLVSNRLAFRARYGTSIRVGGVYTGNLDDDGEKITLSGPAGETVFEFSYKDSWYPITDYDSLTGEGGFSLVAIDPQADPAAFSTSGNWRPSDTLYGAPGAADPGFNPDSVVINEVMSNPAGSGEAWIELYNATTSEVNVGGWFLSNDAAKLTRFRIPDGAVIVPNGYLVFTQSQIGAAFTITPDKDDIFLSDADDDRAGGYRDHVDFGAAAPQVSFGRYAKSTGGTDFTALSAPTQAAPNALPAVGPVVISELMYNPATPGVEFIELENLTGDAINLYESGNGWKFTEGVDYTFPAGASIPAFGHALVVGIDPAVFRTTYNIPADVPIYGPYTGALGNDEDNVKLARPGAAQGTTVPYMTVDMVHYKDSGAWPTQPDGHGPSLTRLVGSGYGNDPANWTAGPSGGTPGAAFVPPSAPWELAASAPTTAAVHLTWTAGGTNADGFRIERSTDGIHFTQVGAPGAIARTWDDVTGLSPGTFYTYRIRAWNNAGLSPWSATFSVSTPSIQSYTLLRSDDTWSYNQNRVSLGTDWIGVSYADTTAAGWLSGKGLFAGLSRVIPLPAAKNTDLNFGPSGDRTPTIYFRTHFNLSIDPSAISSLMLNTVLDDGAAVYLNGNPIPIFTLGMPASWDYTSWSGRTVGDATWEGPFSLPTNDLVRGDNVLAVEVHQCNITSSDLVFGATLTATMLVPTVTATIDPIPAVNLVGLSDAKVVFSEAVNGFDLSDVRLTRGGNPILLTTDQTPTTADHITWTIPNLSAVTSAAGTYTLSIAANGSGIAGSQPGHILGADAAETFQVLGAAIHGTTAAETYYIRLNNGNIQVFATGQPGSNPDYTAPLSGISSLTIDGGGGNDTLDIGVLPFMPLFLGGAGTDRLIISGGSYRLSASMKQNSVEELTLTGYAQVALGSDQQLDLLSVTDSARVTISDTSLHTLVLNSLGLSRDGSVDLADNDIILTQASTDHGAAQVEQLRHWLRSALVGGGEEYPWTGKGLTSTKARDNADMDTAIAVFNNDDGSGGAWLDTFNGLPVDQNSIILKYTYFGDADADGQITADDFAAATAGWFDQMSGIAPTWMTGDFDYDRKVTADDFAMLTSSWFSQDRANPLTATPVPTPVEVTAGNQSRDDEGREGTASPTTSDATLFAPALSLANSTRKPDPNILLVDDLAVLA